MKLIVILGPTAVGKTRLAVALAHEFGGEIITADSRQVYRGMDIGSGKDLQDFQVGTQSIPYHLIDIKNAGEAYDVFQFQQDFYQAYENICDRGLYPILCGGTGMYLQAALDKEQLLEVPTNDTLRKELASFSDEALVAKLLQLNPNQHNTTDLTDRERTIRAIEIELHKQDAQKLVKPSPITESVVFGIRMEREALRIRIKQRLDDRLKDGMLKEVEELLKGGLSHEQLEYYGLEYRFLSQFLRGAMTYDEMYEKLLQAIRRFAKKQMTWFRRMEKMGTGIYWIEADMSQEEKIQRIKSHLFQ